LADVSDSPIGDEDERPPDVLSINQVVAYNLMRARRRQGWTQDETAVHLTRVTGRRWTNATLSAAERSWLTGRTREFNANELVAFAKVFNQPVSYFLLPPDGAERQFTLGPVGQQEGEQTFVSALDILSAALPMQVTPEVLSGAKPHLEARKLSWSAPSTDWLVPELEWGGDEEEEEPDGVRPPSLRAVRTALIRALRTLDAIENPPSPPVPF
jgi:hypothetical protein